MAVNIITGQDTIVPVEDMQHFGIPSISEWEICPENGMNPNHFEEYVKDTLKQGKNKDIYIFTYNAMIIEFFEVMSVYHNIECNFYLNCQKNGLSKYKPDHIYDLYKYLAQPFDIINVYRLRNEYRDL